MSSRKTKRQSGAFYRKEKNRKIEQISKQAGALKKYFRQPERSDPEQNSSNNNADFDYSQPSTSTSTNDNIHNESINIPPDEGDEIEESSSTSSLSFSPSRAECGDESKECSPMTLDDPGTWPTILTKNHIDLLVEHSPKQETNFKFPVDETGRKFNCSYYYKTLVNGEKINRAWLCYSKKLNRIFCFACKLFSNDSTTQIVGTGFCDWRHCSDYLNKHENSLRHVNSVRSWYELKTRLEKNCTIDAEQQNIYNREKKRWRAVIERMIAVVQFLASQNLAFRGTSAELYRRDNGNFLKAVEMLAKFDPVISEHLNIISRCNDNKTRIPHYLGQHFQNEIINILAESIRNEITRIVKKAKYYAIILDSTPDISHTEQITFIIRCVSTTDGKVDIFEFFLGFSPVTNTTGEGLCEFLIEKLLPSLQLEVKDIRGQGYDNGSNMKGKNIGLQKRILNINPRALYVPCAAHTLNLVVNDAANSSGEISGFFGVVQEIYNYFSASPYRWDVLKKHVKGLTLKPLSETRWESRINAIRPLKQNLPNIITALNAIIEDPTRDTKTKLGAKSIIKNVKTFKFICSILIWHDLLSRIDILSKILQNPKLNIAECIQGLDNLKKYLVLQRTDDSFKIFVDSATSLGTELDIDPELPTLRLRKKVRLFEYEGSDEPVSNFNQHFKTAFYFAILDHAISSVDERFTLLSECHSIFCFLYEFYTISKVDLMKACMDLEKKLQVEVNEKDVEKDIDGVELFNEITSFKDIFPDKKQPNEILETIVKSDLISCFPNFALAIRIFLTLPVTVASGERSFSKLKLIKNYLRNNMTQQRLSDLAIISIESEISEKIDLTKVIDTFASQKARKVIL